MGAALVRFRAVTHVLHSDHRVHGLLSIDRSDGGDVESFGRWMDAMAGYIALPDDLPVRKAQVEWTR
eukprot:39660-Eustigmatos_ZCMA.PRE.1